MREIEIFESRHPNREAEADFDALVAIDDHKASLVDELVQLLDPSRLQHWRNKHHARGLPLADILTRGAPLVILSGEVGCGKTAIATSVATPVAKALDARVVCLETPSNIRGAGLVGEISNRITTVFSMAKAKLSGSGTRYGILVIDEADDLATSRAQLQAHHEDRAALNVLVKQVDLLAREQPGLAVILITNRLSVIDPAIRRRVALHLRFERPDKRAQREIIAFMLRGTRHTEADVDELASRCSTNGTRYSSSDLIHRVGRLAFAMARAADKPFGPDVLREALGEVEPTPLLDEALPI